MMTKLILTTVLIANGAPLSDFGARFAERKQEVRRDPPPEEITRGKHYVNSDERRHDLFYERIAGNGGLLIGVGAGQNYVLAGWAEPEAMVVIDFDQVIVDIHQLFALIFRHTNSPEEFVAAWRHQHRTVTMQWIVADFPKGPQRRLMRQTFKEYRDNLSWGITKTRERMAEQGRTTYLDDAEQFATVKRLVDDGRVLAVRGDFTGRRTLADVAELARAMDLTVSTLYLSNIEQYFPWRHGRYRENMLALPFDANTEVLRAYGIGEEHAADHNYRYYVQTGASFHAWMRDREMESVRSLFPAGEYAGSTGFFEVRIRPDELADLIRRKKKAREKRRRPEHPELAAAQP